MHGTWQIADCNGQTNPNPAPLQHKPPGPIYMFTLAESLHRLKRSHPSLQKFTLVACAGPWPCLFSQPGLTKNRQVGAGAPPAKAEEGRPRRGNLGKALGERNITPNSKFGCGQSNLLFVRMVVQMQAEAGFNQANSGNAAMPAKPPVSLDLPSGIPEMSKSWGISPASLSGQALFHPRSCGSEAGAARGSLTR